MASWIAERHDKYGSLIRRVQKYIAGVLNKVVLGYHPDKWVQTEGNIRSEDQNEVEYKMLETPRRPKVNTSTTIARSFMKTSIGSCNIGNGLMPIRREMQAV